MRSGSVKRNDKLSFKMYCSPFWKNENNLYSEAIMNTHNEQYCTQKMTQL